MFRGSKNMRLMQKDGIETEVEDSLWSWWMWEQAWKAAYISIFPYEMEQNKTQENKE